MRIRPATPADRPALTEMLTRCSEPTLPSSPGRYLTGALAGHADHLALVAATPTAVVALASCQATTGATADLAVLVEDAWQRQGIGTGLLNGLLDHADRNGLRTLKATMRPEQDWIMWALRAFGACTVRLSMAVLEVTMRREPHRARLPRTTAAWQPEILAPVAAASLEARFAAQGVMTLLDVQLKELDAVLADEVSQTRHAREQAERLRADASARTRRTAQRLREQGMAQRDISALLGISHQAVSQLLAS